MASKQQLIALIQGAKWSEACQAGDALCHANQSDPEAWFLLSGVHAQMGVWHEAERCAEIAARLAPTVSAAHFNLGYALLRQQKPGAAARFRTTLTLQPDHPAARDLLKDACFAEGLHLAEAGNLEPAIKFLGEALRDAESTKIRMLLGELCLRAKRREAAVTHYHRACELEPESATAHACLADAILLGDPSVPVRNEALEHLRTAVRLDPNYVAARNNLASALQMLGHYDEAVAEYKTVLHQRPGHTASILGLVRAYEGTGRLDEAVAVLRPVLDRAANSPEIALAYGIMAQHMGEREAAIDALRSAPVALATGERETEFVACFTLGDLLDKEGRYDEAFDAYQRAHTLRQFSYHHDELARRFRELAGFFSTARLPQLPRATNRSKLPVFIVGMPRSGTTLVETILASHPTVHGAGELGDILLMRQELADVSGNGRRFPQCLEGMPTESLNKFAARHIEKLASLGPGADRVTDKMPQNFVQLGLIDLLFPGARVIHCMRNPLDTCLSIYSHPFIQHHRYATDLRNLGLYYREYLELMAHWRKVLRIPMYELRYENLTEQPEKTVRALLDFCELPWDDRCLRHHETGRVVNTFSYNQVRNPIYKTSVARWKRYEKHLGPLIDALGDACDPLAVST